MSDRPPQRSPAAAWRRVDGEMVLLQQEAGQLVGLNGVGARVWELLDGARSTDEIVRAISEEFRVDPARVASDVAAFLAELATAKLIEPR